MERNRCIAVHLVGVDLLIDPCRAAAWLPTGGCGHPPLRENRECGCRGALYMRPCLVAVCGSLAGIATAHGRICNPPLQVRCGSTTASNTYSLLLLPSQKKPTCFCKSLFKCWRYLSSRVGKVLSRPRRDQMFFRSYAKNQLAGGKLIFCVGVTYLPVQSPAKYCRRR